MMGNSADCNTNQTPDECEYPDCNGNEQLDECELLDGSATDNDGNYRLDECESDCAITPEWVKLFAADGARSDEFGRAVDVEGEIIVVGAIGDDDQGFNNGAAYVFGKTAGGWKQTQKLVADDASLFSQYRFGRSVAVSGDAAIVGARGAAYAFRLIDNAWIQEDEFVGATPSFGISVDLCGDVAVVGEPDAENVNSLSLGKVYVFRFDGENWQQEDTLSLGTDLDVADFGHVVSVSLDHIYVAAVRDQCFDDASNQAPVSYLFHRDGTTWRRIGRQEPYVDPACQVYELDIAISGNTAVLGAPRHRPTQVHDGAVFVFGCDGVDWEQQSKLLRYELGHEAFGTSVAVDADRVVIGDQSGSNLYVYQPRGEEWAETLELSLPPATLFRGSGEIALNDGVLIVGVNQETGAAEISGAVYVLEDFNGLTSDCGGNGVRDGCETFWFGDADSDGTRGLTDFAAMVECVAGPLDPPNPPVADCISWCVSVFDSDGDSQVDLTDAASFQRLLN